MTRKTEHLRIEADIIIIFISSIFFDKIINKTCTYIYIIRYVHRYYYSNMENNFFLHVRTILVVHWVS